MVWSGACTADGASAIVSVAFRGVSCSVNCGSDSSESGESEEDGKEKIE